jgi:hypothetical protein
MAQGVFLAGIDGLGGSAKGLVGAGADFDEGEDMAVT